MTASTPLTKQQPKSSNAPTADQVMRQSAILNGRGLHQMKTGEEATLRSAMLSFHDSLKSMSQCFSDQMPLQHWQDSFSVATKRSRDHSSNDSDININDESFHLHGSLLAVGRHDVSPNSQAVELVFRRAFSTAQLHTIFQGESCRFQRTMNLSAAFVLFNLGLSHQLCAMKMMAILMTKAPAAVTSTSGASSATTTPNDPVENDCGPISSAAASSGKDQQLQQKRRIYDDLKSAQHFYQQSYRFLVSACPEMHCGPPSHHPVINIFYMACMNNMAQVEASLGRTEQLRVFLKQLAWFVSSVKKSSNPKTVGNQAQACPERNVRRRLSNSSYENVGGSSSNNNNTSNVYIARQANEFFTRVLVVHEYLLTSAAAAA